jgi:hypothetical protein
MTHMQRGGVDIADACAGAETLSQVSTQRQDSRRHPLNEALVTDQTWKGVTPMD